MIVEYVRYELPHEVAADFAEAYEAAGEILSRDQHCVTWELRRGVEEPSRHVVRITWDSQEGHEEQFRAAPAYQEFLAGLKPFREHLQEMGHYELVTAAEGAV
jgi:hemoglobin